jgi:UDP-N-acetylmuramoyl-L-alanyl-D-glutamate--2,6-diaminopimelate ligase
MRILRRAYHFLFGYLSALRYGFPSRNLYVVGVTGTKGKTTAVELIAHVLRESGRSVASLSSLAVTLPGSRRANPTENTMPGRGFIQKFLREAARSRAAYAVLEVTSQGILQYRDRFVEFDAAVFLNLHPEHIEAHGSFEAYRNAKVRFFENAVQRSPKQRKLFVVNAADAAAHHFARAVLGSGAIGFFSRERFRREALRHLGSSSLGWLASGPNLENAAAAFTFAVRQGIPHRDALRALASFPGIPGRMEVLQEHPFRVVIDYAHTPDSLSLVYQSLRRRHGRLIAVLSAAGGGRDRWKRPFMGRAAAAHADLVVLTDEDPYDEDPRRIMSEIRSGLAAAGFPPGRTHEALDRRDAIRQALALAGPGDTVILTGKGSERSIHRAHGRREPWNEREVVRDLLQSHAR